MDRHHPVFRQAALRKLDDLKSQFDAGDGFALLAAIRKCAQLDLVMPEWVATAYIARYDRVLHCQVGSWDKAFGRPYSKGVHLRKLRQRRLLRLDLHKRVWKTLVRQPKTAIDDGLFEKVGAEVGIGKTLCKELYYEAERLLGRQLSKLRGKT